MAYTAGRLTCHFLDHYDRKVLRVVSEWPYIILIFVKADAAVQCSERQALAQQMLDTKLTDLHVVAQKLRETYGNDITYSAQTGMLSPWLALALNEVKASWKAHTTENERLNKLLKLLGERCNRCSYDLASSRAQMKFELYQNPQWSRLEFIWLRC